MHWTLVVVVVCCCGVFSINLSLNGYHTSLIVETGNLTYHAWFKPQKIRWTSHCCKGPFKLGVTLFWLNLDPLPPPCDFRWYCLLILQHCRDPQPPPLECRVLFEWPLNMIKIKGHTRMTSQFTSYVSLCVDKHDKHDISLLFLNVINVTPN